MDNVTKEEIQKLAWENWQLDNRFEVSFEIYLDIYETGWAAAMKVVSQKLFNYL